MAPTSRPTSDTIGNGSSRARRLGSVLVACLLATGAFGASAVLGDSSEVSGTSPNLASAAAVSVSSANSCVVEVAGTVKCWGDNSDGALGDGSNTNSSVPVTVSGISTAVAVSAGSGFACALLQDTTVKCWGYNFYGTLGDGSNTNSNVPVSVSGLTGVASISSGSYFTCAVLTSGAVKCWGYNNKGQLGDGGTTDSNVPVTVGGLTNARDVNMGQHTACAVTTAGAVKCWGDGQFGQMGNGTNTGTNTSLQDPTGLSSGIVAVSLGTDTACAVTSAGAVKCWGGGEQGQLGDGNTGVTYKSLVPVDATVITDQVAQISVGDDTTCFVTASGAVKCFGENRFSTIGDGGTTDSTTPVQVPGLTSGVKAIANTVLHTCAILDTGAVKCWGSNWSGELGAGDSSTYTSPVSVTGVSAVIPTTTTLAPTTTGGGSGGGGSGGSDLPEAGTSSNILVLAGFVLLLAGAAVTRRRIAQ